MRLVTGATARSILSNLKSETGWISFRQKCNDSMLTTLFKIKNDLAPAYLTNLLQAENKTIVQYNLHNSHHIVIPACRLKGHCYWVVE